MTLTESAASAVLPWNSIDAGSALLDALPQQEIDVCLNCKYHAGHCENCHDWNTRGFGRPKANIDTARLRELLQLRVCNRDICAEFGVSERTLQRAKKQLGGMT